MPFHLHDFCLVNGMPFRRVKICLENQELGVSCKNAPRSWILERLGGRDDQPDGSETPQRSYVSNFINIGHQEPCQNDPPSSILEAFLQLTPNSQFSKQILTFLNGMPVKGPKNHNENGMLPSQSKDAILKLKNVVAEWHATLMTY